MFGQYTAKTVLAVAVVVGVIGFLGGRWTCHAPAPAPLTEPEVAALEESGHAAATEGPVADPTPGLPGKPVGRIGVTMPRRDKPHNLPITSAPGRAGVDPAAAGAAEDPAPVPIPAGLTSDDISGSAQVDIRQAGESLWTRAVMTCCIGHGDEDICRTELGAETEATFDRSLLCGRPRLPRLHVLSLGLEAPDAAVVGRWEWFREGKMLGWWVSGSYALHPASVTETAQSEYATARVTAEAEKVRVGAGISLRIGK